MKRVDPVLIAALIGGAFLLLSGRARAATPIDPYGEVLGYEPYPDDPMTDPIDNPVETSDPDYLSAFVHMIQVAETGARAVASGNTYRMLYGCTLFDDLSDHPANLGWPGVRLTDQMCRNAGFGPGCVSTAAGAGQLIKPTWNRVRVAGRWGPRLPDFGVDSQNEAIRRLLIECGSLAYIERGEFTEALRRAAPVWASLPGSTAKQGPKSYAEVFAIYSNALGVA